MKILVYGAGALDSLYAARLQEAGQNVSILARGQRLQDIRELSILLVAVPDRAYHNDSRQRRRTTRASRCLRPGRRRDGQASSRSHLTPAFSKPPDPEHLISAQQCCWPSGHVKALGHERVLLGFADNVIFERFQKSSSLLHALPARVTLDSVLEVNLTMLAQRLEDYALAHSH